MFAFRQWVVRPTEFGPLLATRSLEPSEVALLNRTDRPTPMPGEAEVKYLDGDFRVMRPGAFVRCAVTGVSIPLEELRYWSVDLQEAYASPEAVLQRTRLELRAEIAATMRGLLLPLHRLQDHLPK